MWLRKDYVALVFSYCTMDAVCYRLCVVKHNNYVRRISFFLKTPEYCSFIYMSTYSKSVVSIGRFVYDSTRMIERTVLVEFHLKLQNSRFTHCLVMMKRDIHRHVSIIHVIILTTNLAAVVSVCVWMCVSVQNLTKFCPHTLISNPNVPKFLFA